MSRLKKGYNWSRKHLIFFLTERQTVYSSKHKKFQLINLTHFSAWISMQKVQLFKIYAYISIVLLYDRLTEGKVDVLDFLRTNLNGFLCWYCMFVKFSTSSSQLFSNNFLTELALPVWADAKLNCFVNWKINCQSKFNYLIKLGKYKRGSKW